MGAFEQLVAGLAEARSESSRVDLATLQAMAHRRQGMDGDVAAQWLLSHGGFSRDEVRAAIAALRRDDGDDGFLQDLEGALGGSIAEASYKTKNGVGYFASHADAAEVLARLKPDYPEARMVEYGIGWTVQYYLSGPYWPEEPADGRKQMYWIGKESVAEAGAAAPEHKLIRHGGTKGSWGECSCGNWAWLGNYEGPKGRLPKLRAEHAAHVAWATRPKTEGGRPHVVTVRDKIVSQHPTKKAAQAAGPPPLGRARRDAVKLGKYAKGESVARGTEMGSKFRGLIERLAVEESGFITRDHLASAPRELLDLARTRVGYEGGRFLGSAADSLPRSAGDAVDRWAVAIGHPIAREPGTQSSRVVALAREIAALGESAGRQAMDGFAQMVERLVVEADGDMKKCIWCGKKNVPEARVTSVCDNCLKRGGWSPKGGWPKESRLAEADGEKPPKDSPPVCECGTRARREGKYWVCSNSACSGYGEILRPVREAITAQHHRAVADILSTHRHPVAHAVARDLGNYFHGDNKSFNREGFLKASGVPARARDDSAGGGGGGAPSSQVRPRAAARPAAVKSAARPRAGAKKEGSLTSPKWPREESAFSVLVRGMLEDGPLSEAPRRGPDPWQWDAAGRYSGPPIMSYKPRFVTDAQLSELFDLYHLARTALAGQSPTKHDQMLWAANEFSKAHPGVSATAAYKDLSSSRDVGGF